MSPSEQPGALEYRNVATGEATVDAQIGVIHGDAYFNSSTATPEERAEHGKNLLERGSAREAEKLLVDAIRLGCTGPRVAYYWALAILAGRSSEQVEADHLNNLDTAFGMVPTRATDTWSQALLVVKGLIDLLRTVDRQGKAEPASESEALAAYDHLDPERSAEIRRYLDQVLDGVVGEHIHQAAAEEAARERLANERVNRAWKFFEPEPAWPEPIPPPPRTSPLWAWLKLIAAVVVAGVATIPVIPALARGGAIGLGLTLLGVGLVGSLYYGLQRRFVLHEREIEERMFTIPMEGELPWKVEGQAKFAEMVVAGAFNKSAPSDPEEKELWKQVTREYRLNLTRQFVEVYQDPMVQRRPSVVRWLARWHADQLAERWDSEHPDGLYGRIKTPGWVYLGIAVAAVASAAGAVLLWWPLWTHGAFTDYGFFPILIVSGVRVAFDQGCCLASSVRANAREKEAADRRHQRELAVYRKWCDILADRPKDAEMASWLDYDERYLRAKAMELYQVTNPSLIGQVTFSAPSKNARYAMTPSGPKRYTEYDVGILLMTRGGVRFAEFHLDMRTGGDQDPERLSFRYPTIASVHVLTIHAGPGRRTDRGSKKSGSADQGDRDDSLDKRPMQRSGYRTIFRIVLLNQEEPIEAIFDLFDDEVEDTPEEPHELVARALDVSGVAGALWMMEAITADGKDWLQAQEARSSRRRYRSQQLPGADIAPNGNGVSRTDEPVLT